LETWKGLFSIPIFNLWKLISHYVTQKFKVPKKKKIHDKRTSKLTNLVDLSKAYQINPMHLDILKNNKIYVEIFIVLLEEIMDKKKKY